MIDLNFQKVQNVQNVQNVWLLRILKHFISLWLVWIFRMLHCILDFCPRLNEIWLVYRNVALKISQCGAVPLTLSSVKGDDTVAWSLMLDMVIRLIGESVVSDMCSLKARMLYQNVALYSWLLSSVKRLWFMWEYGLQSWLHLIRWSVRGSVVS